MNEELTNGSADMGSPSCEGCAYCKYYAKVYVPDVDRFGNVPRDMAVCTYFWDTERSDVMYLGDNKGMCEVFTSK